MATNSKEARIGNDIPASQRLLVKVRDRTKCVRCAVPCSHNGHWHHRRSRSVRDTLTHTAANGVWLCPTCHRWAHDNPFLARTEGLIISRWADPTTTPVNHALFGTVLLTTNGGYQPYEEHERNEEP